MMVNVSVHIVNLVHVRASETFTITNSKNESYPTGSFYPVFVLSTHTHSISQISQIRIQSITYMKASHSHPYAPQHLRLFPIISSIKAEPHAKATIPTYWQTSFMELQILFIHNDIKCPNFMTLIARNHRKTFNVST